jgi:phosphoribosylformylglycinamidine synthase
MSLRAVKSPLAPKMTMEHGSVNLRSIPMLQTCSLECSASIRTQWRKRWENSTRIGQKFLASPARFPQNPAARMKAKIIVTPKKAVVDPQGKTVQNALEHMGYRGIKAVHVGKYLEVELDGGDKESARKSLEEACHKFLSNPVIEDYKLEIE